jgi:hypothetical protein
MGKRIEGRTAPCAHVGEDTLLGLSCLVGSWHWHVGQCVNWSVWYRKGGWKWFKNICSAMPSWSTRGQSHATETNGDPVFPVLAPVDNPARWTKANLPLSHLEITRHPQIPLDTLRHSPRGTASPLSLSQHLHNVVGKVAPTPRRQ